MKFNSLVAHWVPIYSNEHYSRIFHMYEKSENDGGEGTELLEPELSSTKLPTYRTNVRMQKSERDRGIHRKFSAVFGQISANNSILILPWGTFPMETSKKTLLGCERCTDKASEVTDHRETKKRVHWI